MAKGQYKGTVIRSSGEKGIYDKGDWLRESRLHLLSAQMLRKCSAETKPMISTLMSSGSGSKQRADMVMLISQREAGNKSSILLLGYAFEMLLKSGLVCLYVGVPREAFCRDVKKRYGHRWRQIAVEIEVPLSESDLGRVDMLSGWITDEARYPVTPCDETSYPEQWNSLVSAFWDDTQFQEWLSLYEKIHAHVSVLDASRDDPKVPRRWVIDDDGYVIYRIGGKLRPRIMVHYSSVQKENGDNTKESLKILLLDNSDGAFNRYLSRDWDIAVYAEIE